MRIGVIGAGRVGGALTRALARAGHEVLVANRRGRVSLMPLIEEIGSGAQPVRPVEAARAPVVVLAVPFDTLEELLDEVGPLDGTILVDATNAWAGWEREPGDVTSSQAVARWAPGARVVKALNTVHATLIPTPHTDTGAPLAAPVAGDDPEAVGVVSEALGHVGFAPVAVGALDRGALMEPDGPLFGARVDADELRKMANAAA